MTVHRGKMWPFKYKKEVIKEPAYWVEYYPTTYRYYAVCDGRYLRSDMDTGYITLRENIGDVWSWNICHSKEEAEKFINSYKEQNGVNVVKIPI